MKNWKRILLIALAVYALGGASISRDDQIGQTAKMIADFIK